MVRNNSPDGKRSHMTAFVSDNDGATWKGGLLLDERESSYPDGIQAEDGEFFIIYDHQRYTLNRAGKRLRTDCRDWRRKRSRRQASHGQGAPSPGRDTTSGHGRYVGSTGEMKTQLITAVAAQWSCRESRPAPFLRSKRMSRVARRYRTERNKKGPMSMKYRAVE